MSVVAPNPLKADPVLCEQRAGMALPEFVAFVALLMALNALAIDVMLPAMGDIASELGAQDENDAQLIVVVYVLGFGFPQLIIGPLADRFGRRPVLFVSLMGYIGMGLGCMFAREFETLLVWRFMQGVFASGCRVVAASVVRDIYAGRGMARIMSLVMTVFMVVPILAPSLGQLILFVAPWEWTFGLLVVGGLLMLAWSGLRLKETLPPERKAKLSVRGVLGAYKLVFTTPVTLGYMLASGVIFGALFTFIASSEQIFTDEDVFNVGETFPLWFAGIAFTMSVATYTNSRLVERIGMRRMSHGALIGFTVFSLLTLIAMNVNETLMLFFPLFALTFACFGLIGANFTSLAMEPLGKIAGTGSAVHGFATTTIAGSIGGFIASTYDQSTVPILVGYTGLGVITLLIVLVTENGRLFSSR